MIKTEQRVDAEITGKVSRKKLIEGCTFLMDSSRIVENSTEHPDQKFSRALRNPMKGFRVITSSKVTVFGKKGEDSDYKRLYAGII